MLGAISLLLLTAAITDHMQAPTPILGRYYQQGWSRFKGDICQERDEGRVLGMAIEPKELRLGVKKYRIVFYEEVPNNGTHLWVADTKGQALLFHLSLTPADGAVFVVSETAQAQLLAANSDVVDAGVIGTFLKC